MNITVRFAQRDELEQINIMRREVNDLHVSGRPDIFAPGFIEELQNYIYVLCEKPDHKVIAAFADGELCGFATVCYLEKQPSPYSLGRKIYQVEEFGVSKNYRRIGAATAMIEFIKNDARRIGFDRIELDMWEFNKTAYKFYRSVGFTTYRRYMELNVNGYPTRETAEKLLSEGGKLNPGAWTDHSRVVAKCAERIAEKCGDIDSEKAYVLGLLHDIGRRFGVSGFKHVLDSYTFMNELCYPEAAKVCLTHSFSVQDIEDYIGKIDVSPEQYEYIKNELANVIYDDYDRLIQLCDSICMSTGAVPIEIRMGDVKQRYGNYPEKKWEKNISLLHYFSVKANEDIEKLTQGITT